MRDQFREAGTECTDCLETSSERWNWSYCCSNSTTENRKHNEKIRIIKSRFQPALNYLLTRSSDKQSSSNPWVLLSIFSMWLWERSNERRATTPAIYWNQTKSIKEEEECYKKYEIETVKRLYQYRK